MISTETVLDRIRDQLLAEAELNLGKAETYQHSKRQGLRNSTPVYLQRAWVALTALEHLEAAS
jgi:hypothetical protein